MNGSGGRLAGAVVLPTLHPLESGLLHRLRPRLKRKTISMRTLPPAVRADRSAFAGFRFPPGVSILAVRWSLQYGLSYATSKSYLPSAAWRSTTSPSTAGCGSHRCWPTPPDWGLLRWL